MQTDAVMPAAKRLKSCAFVRVIQVKLMNQAQKAEVQKGLPH